MIVIATFCMHEDYNLPAEHAERDPARFTVIPANVLAGDGETLPNLLSADKVQSVPDIGPTLPFVPTGRELNCSCKIPGCEDLK
jgi:hypothetical protein